MDTKTHVSSQWDFSCNLVSLVFNIMAMEYKSDFLKKKSDSMVCKVFEGCYQYISILINELSGMKWAPFKPQVLLY